MIRGLQKKCQRQKCEKEVQITMYSFNNGTPERGASQWPRSFPVIDYVFFFAIVYDQENLALRLLPWSCFDLALPCDGRVLLSLLVSPLSVLQDDETSHGSTI